MNLIAHFRIGLTLGGNRLLPSRRETASNHLAASLAGGALSLAGGASAFF
jgi:hypothetical protein